MLFDNLLKFKGDKVTARFEVAEFLDHNLEAAVHDMRKASEIAHKFRFSNESARLASSFVFKDDDEEYYDPEAVVTLKDLCKLPFDSVWVEYPERVRHNMASDWGFLLYKTTLDDAEGIAALAFQAYKHISLLTSSLMFIPESIHSIDNGRAFGYRAFSAGGISHNAHKAKDGASISVAQVVALLAFLNSPNIVDQTLIEVRGAAKRAAAGKKKLHEYHLIDINKAVKEAMKLSEHANTHEGRRLHWKRGHFKVRKTGVFWWKPHLAGRKELGFVEKDYNVV